MQLWRSILAYDGTAFHGWQVQPGLSTVQGTLASALHHVTQERVLPQGSGRTDAGVHALGQVASFALEAPIPPDRLLRAINRVLPPSVRMLQVEHAAPEFHARHSAVSKTYEYRVFCRTRGVPGTADRICAPFSAPYLYDYRRPFDLDRANRAAAHVVGEHDFSSFAASDPDLTTRQQDVDAPTRGNVRHIFHSAWQLTDDPARVLYKVTGSGFLHHMVRNLVGTFLEVASGRTDPDRIPEILAQQDRSAAGPTAPARGLYLVEVNY